MIKNYKVYMHHLKNTPHYYIGITSQKPESRWGKNGHNYKNQPKFYNAIQKYGWNNFEHIIIYNNLTEQEALVYENQLIQQYNSINNGYNISSGGGVGYKKPVRCITTGKTYDSVTAAAADVGVSPSALSHCLRGDHRTSGEINNVKLEWCFVNAVDNQRAIQKRSLYDAQKYNQQSLIDNYIVEFYNGTTITNIAKKYGKSKATISNYLKNANVDVLPVYKTKRKAVAMYTKDWEYIKTFETMTQALVFVGKTDTDCSRLKKRVKKHDVYIKGIIENI